MITHHRLTPLLLLFAASATLHAAPADAPPPDPSQLMSVVRVYDVRDLITVSADFNDPPHLGPQLALDAKPATQPAAAPKVTRETLLADLIKSMREKFAIDSLQELKGQLIVRASSQTHEAIKPWLETKRDQRGVQVVIETRFMTGNAAINHLLNAFGNLWESHDTHKTWTRSLSREQFARVLQVHQADRNSTLLTAPRMTLFDHQRAYVLVANQKAYVADLKPSTTQPAKFDPVIDLIKTGVLLDLKATVNENQTAITLELRPELCTLLDLQPRAWPKAPPGQTLTVQVPTYQSTKVDTSVTLPDQRYSLLLLTPKRTPANKDNQPEPVLLAVTAKIVNQRQVPANAVMGVRG